MSRDRAQSNKRNPHPVYRPTITSALRESVITEERRKAKAGSSENNKRGTPTNSAKGCDHRTYTNECIRKTSNTGYVQPLDKQKDTHINKGRYSSDQGSRLLDVESRCKHNLPRCPLPSSGQSGGAKRDRQYAAESDADYCRSLGYGYSNTDLNEAKLASLTLMGSSSSSTSVACAELHRTNDDTCTTRSRTNQCEQTSTSNNELSSKNGCRKTKAFTHEIVGPCGGDVVNETRAKCPATLPENGAHWIEEEISTDIQTVVKSNVDDVPDKKGNGTSTVSEDKIICTKQREMERFPEHESTSAHNHHHIKQSYETETDNVHTHSEKHSKSKLLTDANFTHKSLSITTDEGEELSPSKPPQDSTKVSEDMLAAQHSRLPVPLPSALNEPQTQNNPTELIKSQEKNPKPTKTKHSGQTTPASVNIQIIQ